MNPPTVSVVIPTIGRPAVREAVVSAINQTHPPLEVLVAIDRTDGELPLALADLRDSFRPIWTGGVGPSGARMQASMEACGDIIAFLDDDDTWLPSKLERQLAAWPNYPDSRFTVMSSRHAHCQPNGEMVGTGPDLLFESSSGQSMATYLFRRTQIRYSQAGPHPSTIVCDRALLVEVPWNAELRLHEDWDWLLRVADRADTRIVILPDVLTRVAVGDSQSLSRVADWQVSRTWLESHADRLSKREIGDFLLCYPAVLAFRAGNYHAGIGAARYALAKGRPGIYAWLIWLLNLTSPKVVEKGSMLLNRVKRLGATRKTMG